MEAIMYDIELTTDILHGWKSIIKEIHIPRYNMFINKEACFILEHQEDRIDKAQNKINIHLDEDLVKDLAALITKYDVVRLEKERSHNFLWNLIKEE